MHRWKTAAGIGVAALLAGLAPFSAGRAGDGPVSDLAPGFLTQQAPQLVALEPGVRVEPLLTAGDVVGGATAGYQMSGIPDGIGYYRSSGETIEVYVNHELALADDDVSDSRVSHLTVDNAGRVLSASYPVDGTEGFEEFCSSSLDVLGGVPWYLTGEEAPQSARHGTSIALNTQTGRWVETPHFGHMWHEQVLPVRGLSTAFLGLAEDGNAGRSQLYAYTADRFNAAIRGHGTLRGWVPDDPVADGNPSPGDISGGETMSGSFVRIAQTRNLDPKTLESASQRMGMFDFVRIEDMVADPNHPGVLYFADTGAANQETIQGRLYKLEIDPADPTRASISVVLDGDRGDDIHGPDNLGVSDHALVIQEDRNWHRSGPNDVLVYDLASGSLRAVARPLQPDAITEEFGPARWESSGVIDASTLFGDGWWLLDVQGDKSKVPQPGLSLQPSSTKGPGGQLLKVYIPGT
jgi:hypothetical protein